MFFDSWESSGRTIITGVIAYIGLVLFLRLSGKRTLSQKDPFDFVITTALGSTLAQIVLSKEVAVADELLAFVTIIGLQFVSTWLSTRSRIACHLVKSRPTLLFYQGQFLREAMQRERVPETEIWRRRANTASRLSKI